MAKHQAAFTFRAIAFGTAHPAIAHTEADGRALAIRRGGTNRVVSPTDADRLAALGTAFAHLGPQRGRIVTVPVNG